MKAKTTQKCHNSSSSYTLPGPGFKSSLKQAHVSSPLPPARWSAEDRGSRTQFTTTSDSRCCCTLHKLGGFIFFYIFLYFYSINKMALLGSPQQYPQLTMDDKNVARAIKILAAFSVDYLKPSGWFIDWL